MALPGLNWTGNRWIGRRLKVVAVGIILLAAELEMDAVVEDGLTVLKLRLRLLLDVAARDRENEADARVLIGKGQRVGVVPGQAGGGRSDGVVIDHRGDVPTAERLGDEHQPVDRVAVVAVEAIAIVVQHSQPPMGAHPAEAQNAAPHRGADFAVDALDRDRVADRVDPGGGRRLGAGKNAEGVAIRPAETVIRRGSPNEVVQGVDLHLDPHFLGDIERRLEAKPHVHPGRRPLLGEG